MSLLLVLGLALVPASSAAAADGPKLYWSASSGGSLQRADLDFTNVEDVAIAIVSPRALALGCDGATLYWADPFVNKIARAEFDLANGRDVVTSLDLQLGIAFDCAAGKMYFIDGNQGTPQGPVESRILRANLDGSDLEVLVEGLVNLRSIALDVAGGKLYWTRFPSGSVGRVNLDGTGVETLLEGSANGIALDPAGGKMYLARQGGIQRADLDGSNLEADFITTGYPGPASPDHVAIDVAGGKVYWAGPALQPEIARANLADGSEVEVLIGPLAGTFFFGLALDLAASRIYWTQMLTEPGAPLLQRADLDGGNVEPVIAGQVLGAQGVAVDARRGKVYFTSNHEIRRSELDGSNPEILVSHVVPRPGGLPPIAVPFGDDIDLDIPCQKLYFSVPRDPIEGSVYRGELDGSNLERLTALVTPPRPSPQMPRGLAFDAAAQRIYWGYAGSFPSTLEWADAVDFSGASVETGFVPSIVVDRVNGHLYWLFQLLAAPFDYRIMRANLDGTSPEELVTGLSSAWGLAVDPGTGTIYWTDVTGVHDSHGNSFAGGGGRLALYLGPDPGPPADDSDGDGYPDHCDADYDNDGVAGGPDFRALRRSFQATQGEPAYDPAIDCDGDGSVGMPDFVCFRRGFGRPPGTRLLAPGAAGGARR